MTTTNDCGGDDNNTDTNEGNDTRLMITMAQRTTLTTKKVKATAMNSTTGTLYIIYKEFSPTLYVHVRFSLYMYRA